MGRKKESGVLIIWGRTEIFNLLLEGTGGGNRLHNPFEKGTLQKGGKGKSWKKKKKKVIFSFLPGWGGKILFIPWEERIFGEGRRALGRGGETLLKGFLLKGMVDFFQRGVTGRGNNNNGEEKGRGECYLTRSTQIKGGGTIGIHKLLLFS